MSSHRSPHLSEPPFLHVGSREQTLSPLTFPRDVRTLAVSLAAPLALEEECSLSKGWGAPGIRYMVWMLLRGVHVLFGGCPPRPGGSSLCCICPCGGLSATICCEVWARASQGEPTPWRAASVRHLPVREWSAGVGFGAQVIADGQLSVHMVPGQGDPRALHLQTVPSVSLRTAKPERSGHYRIRFTSAEIENWRG